MLEVTLTKTGPLSVIYTVIESIKNHNNQYESTEEDSSIQLWNLNAQKIQLEKLLGQIFPKNQRQSLQLTIYIYIYISCECHELARSNCNQARTFLNMDQTNTMYPNALLYQKSSKNHLPWIYDNYQYPSILSYSHWNHQTVKSDVF